MLANKARGIATSAIRKVKSRPWRTTLAPILISFSRSVVGDHRDIVGGRAGAYEKVLRDAKDAAIADMTEQAREWGADAIVGISLDYEVVGGKGSMLMVVATGTAVTAKKA